MAFLVEVAYVQTEDAMINVAIVEDEDEVREGLGVLINGSEGFRCVSIYSSAEKALPVY